MEMSSSLLDTPVNRTPRQQGLGGNSRFQISSAFIMREKFHILTQIKIWFTTRTRQRPTQHGEQPEHEMRKADLFIVRGISSDQDGFPSLWGSKLYTVAALMQNKLFISALQFDDF